MVGKKTSTGNSYEDLMAFSRREIKSITVIQKCFHTIHLVSRDIIGGEK